MTYSVSRDISKIVYDPDLGNWFLLFQYSVVQVCFLYFITDVVTARKERLMSSHYPNSFLLIKQIQIFLDALWTLKLKRYSITSAEHTSFNETSDPTFAELAVEFLAEFFQDLNIAHLFRQTSSDEVDGVVLQIHGHIMDLHKFRLCFGWTRWHCTVFYLVSMLWGGGETHIWGEFRGGVFGEVL